MMSKKLTFFVSVLLATNLIIDASALAQTVIDKKTQAQAVKYSDLSGYWAEKQILALIDKGVVKGKIDGNGNIKINPSDYITRAEFISILVKNNDLKIKSDKVKQFSDVKATAWYKSAVDIVVSNGLVDGYPDKTFKSENSITRAEIASLVTKTFALQNSKTAKDYKDVNNKEWYYNSVMTCRSNEVINGYSDGYFLPKKKATRGEAFAIISNVNSKKELLAKQNLKPITVAQGNTDNGSKPSTTKVEPAKPTSVPDKPKTPVTPPKPTTTSRGEDDHRPMYTLKPTITFGTPFSDDKTYFETKEASINIEVNTYGNTMKNVNYSILNDSGKGQPKSVVDSAYPELTSVVRDVYTSKSIWKIAIQDLPEDLNTIKFTGSDIYGNENSASVKLLRIVDSDGDGLNNYEERKLGTDINLKDTDGDGLTDYEEAKQTFTDPLIKDSDGDGFTDYQEVVEFKWKTSPILYSSIGNGMSDSEIDSDGDGLSNYDEYFKYHTDPFNPDTDGDGLPDGVEVEEYGTDPNVSDSNGNGINDMNEVISGAITSIKASNANGLNEEISNTNLIGPYGIPQNQDLDAKPIILGDLSLSVVLRIQLMLNTLLVADSKEQNALKYTGIFDLETKNAIYDIFAIDQVNAAVFDELVKRVKLVAPIKDDYNAKRSYMGYSANENTEGIKYIKGLLDEWKKVNSGNLNSLFTIESLKEQDGTYSGIIDENTVAMIKLFQSYNGFITSGKINDITVLTLLSPESEWHISGGSVKNDKFVKDGFGKYTFYRYLSDEAIPLNPVYYSQTYGPWSHDPYYAVKRGAAQNGRVIARNGCGPSATSMVMATLADRNITPGTMAKFSMDNNCITSDYDTEATLYPNAANYYGLKYEYSKNIDYVKEYLKKGNYLGIASMGVGHLTGGGHLIALMGVIRLPGEDFDRIIVYDSNTANQSYGNDGSVVVSRQTGVVYVRTDVLQKETALGFWLVWKG